MNELNSIIRKVKAGDVSLGGDNKRLKSFAANSAFCALFASIETTNGTDGAVSYKAANKMESAAITVTFDPTKHKVGTEPRITITGQRANLNGNDAKCEVEIDYDGKKAVGKLNFRNAASLANKGTVTANIVSGFNLNGRNEPVLWVTFSAVQTLSDDDVLAFFEAFDNLQVEESDVTPKKGTGVNGG